MRTILLVALTAAVMGLQANLAQAQAQASPQAQAQTRAVQSKPATNAAAEIAARPDAFRYYWHDGVWWYFTPQNTWLRWNGSVWVVHHSINDANAFVPVPQPSAGNAGVAPSTDNDTGGGTYRYDINRRKGGL